MSQWDLHDVRPGSIDAKGRRVFLHPSEVKGLWHKRRTVVQAILIVVFLILPWVKIGGVQALLLDVANRHFNILGLQLRAHNAPLMFFVLAIVGFGFFFITAVWGRIWCGWACPQTVFIDGVFRRMERWIEGPATVRRTLENAPWSLHKITRRTAKWIVFTALSLVITHSFLAYFVGTERLAEMVTHSPSENWTSFLFIAFSTAIILFDFGWLREQFCMIACPYGRFQSVLMDSRSLVVGYDEKRGEPRRGVTSALPQGDCVNCYRCVQVCPTGIDIRRGVQMECIACTACVDACDDVMTKIKKPTGLIRYSTLAELRRPIAERTKTKSRKLTSRSWIYLAVVVLSAIALTIALLKHQDLDVQVLRGRGLPYQEVPAANPGEKPKYLNQFYAEITNTSSHNLDVSVQADIELVTTQKEFKVREGKTERIGFFLKFPKETRKANLQFNAIIDGKTITLTREVPLVGPL